jgi:hypothetical protein
MKSGEVTTNVLAGSTATLLTMVHRFIRYIHSWCAGISAGDIWSTNVFRRTSYSSVGMVYWQYHGVLHSEFRYVAPNYTCSPC